MLLFRNVKQIQLKHFRLMQQIVHKVKAKMLFGYTLKRWTKLVQ